MEFTDHPYRPGWKMGDEVTDIRDRPPASPIDEMRCLYGTAPGDWEHRLYLVPAEATVEDVVEFFEVGLHGARRHGWNERDTMDLVAATLTEVAAIVPGTIELASSAALRFRFSRRLRDDEIEAIELVYRRVDELQAGLAAYVNGTSGGSLLDEIRDTGVLRLWWD